MHSNIEDCYRNASNNGMPPNAHQHASYRELGRRGVECAAGDAGR